MYVLLTTPHHALQFFAIKWHANSLNPHLSQVSVDCDQWLVPPDTYWQKAFTPVASFDTSFQAVAGQESHGRIRVNRSNVGAEASLNVYA